MQNRGGGTHFGTPVSVNLVLGQVRTWKTHGSSLPENDGKALTAIIPPTHAAQGLSPAGPTLETFHSEAQDPLCPSAWRCCGARGAAARRTNACERGDRQAAVHPRSAAEGGRGLLGRCASNLTHWPATLQLTNSAPISPLPLPTPSNPLPLVRHDGWSNSPRPTPQRFSPAAARRGEAIEGDPRQRPAMPCSRARPAK